MTQKTIRAKYETCELCGTKYPEPRELYHPPDQCTPEFVAAWVTPEEFAAAPGPLPDPMLQFVAGCALCEKICVLPEPELVWVTDPGDSLRAAQDRSYKRTAIRYAEVLEDAMRAHHEADHSTS